MKIIREAIDRVDSYTRAQLVLTHGMNKARKEHMGILVACEIGDDDSAVEMTRQYILKAHESLVEYLKRQKEE
ncbi:MAG: hypothetical protein V7727_12925 [Sneathiella sp.]